MWPAGDTGAATCTPGFNTGLFAAQPTAITPLCLDLDSLQISGASSQPAAFTSASSADRDDNSASPAASGTFSLPGGIGIVGDTPGLQGPGPRTGWSRSLFETPGMLIAVCADDDMHAAQ